MSPANEFAPGTLLRLGGGEWTSEDRLEGNPQVDPL